jgi:hypothetical protein
VDQVDLSIVIPTRNRPANLKFALESVYSNLSKINFEVIISSNGFSLEGDLEGIPPHLLGSVKIVRSDLRLSMGENWRFGFSFATGKWIHILGDDDCVSLRSPDSLNELLKRDGIDGLVLRTGKFNWKIDSEGNYYQDSLQEPEESELISQGDETVPLPKDWESLQPRSYPNATGRSMVRREYLMNLDQKGVLFAAVSPDWFTGAYFAFSNSRYLICDILWANIGTHPESSIFQIYNPHSKVSLEEAKVQSFTIHSHLKSKTNTFPTTWLIRLDSILRARELLGLSTSISNIKLVRDALNTTPRYVHKVAIKLVSDSFTRAPVVLLTLFPSYMKSFWKKINS